MSVHELTFLPRLGWHWQEKGVLPPWQAGSRCLGRGQQLLWAGEALHCTCRGFWVVARGEAGIRSSHTPVVRLRQGSVPVVVNMQLELKEDPAFLRFVAVAHIQQGDELFWKLGVPQVLRVALRGRLFGTPAHARNYGLTPANAPLAGQKPQVVKPKAVDKTVAEAKADQLALADELDEQPTRDDDGWSNLMDEDPEEEEQEEDEDEDDANERTKLAPWTLR